MRKGYDKQPLSLVGSFNIFVSCFTVFDNRFYLQVAMRGNNEKLYFVSVSITYYVNNCLSCKLLRIRMN